jgi:anthranilate phosphoribosyltransferase
MFAPLMHPAMRHVGPVRRELGVQTVMNMVGPLANPAHAGRQVVGVSDSRASS